LAAVLLIDPIRFVIFNPRGKTGFEMFLALGQMFGALVLALSPVAPVRSRMTWFAGGLLVLGVGALGFGYLLPLIDATPDPNVSMYGSLFVRSLATILIAIAMVPSRVPSLGRRGVLIVLVIGGILSTTLYLIGDDLPRLVRVADMDSLVSTTATRVFPGLSGWHLGLGLVPLGASITAIWGAIRYYRVKEVGAWMIVGIVLLAGAQLHSLFWPSMYSSVLTTTSVLRFGLTVIVIAGGVLELRSLSLERAALLADEKERVQQLEELGMLKRDFTSIVAHELATPLAAIGNLAHMITLGVLTPEQQQQTADRIQSEARILQLLVRDIQASADVERDDFTVFPRPVSLGLLIEDAQAYAGTVQAEHPLTVDALDDVEVLADPDRIGQVIRNLLNNAVRHTPAGTPITLRAVHLEEGVRIDVADRGPGIAPADQGRILEKFGRGSGAASEGRGLGLYLSQRILQAHGTRLTIQSEPGHGACFSFILKECL
jgi:signal transduction histidine kinase